MNIEKNTPQEMVEIATAFRDRKQIEMAYVGNDNVGNDNWMKLSGASATLNFAYYRYRIAREPQRRWIATYRDGTERVYRPQSAACDPDCVKCTEYVEVMK